MLACQWGSSGPPWAAAGGMSDLTLLIAKAHDGDAQARDAVYTRIYDDLRVIAHARLTSGDRNTMLNTTSLVNEAYLRLAKVHGLKPEDRYHYLAYASKAMRSVIVDFVRARAAERRGGSVERLTLDTNLTEDLPAGESEILRVHEALKELAALDEQLVKVVEMRYFAGLTEPEVAAALGVADRTVRRYWQKARMLLAAALG